MVIDHVAAIESTHPGIDERCRQQDRAAERNEQGGELLRCGDVHRQQFAVMEIGYLPVLSTTFPLVQVSSKRMEPCGSTAKTADHGNAQRRSP